MVLDDSNVRIDETDWVINGAVHVTPRPNILVCSPAITDERSARFDPCTDDDRQSQRFCPEKEQEMFYRTRVQHHQTPTGLNRVPPIFSPTDLVLVDFNSLVRTASLLRAAFQVNQHILSLEHTPVRDCVITEVMFVLNLDGRFAAQDVVSYKTSWKVSLLFWNREPCLTNLDLEHLIPATILWHRHLKPSGAVGSAYRVISQPQNWLYSDACVSSLVGKRQ